MVRATAGPVADRFQQQDAKLVALETQIQQLTANQQDQAARSSTDLANVRSEVEQLKEDTRQAFTQTTVQMREEIANSNAAFARTLQEALLGSLRS